MELAVDELGARQGLCDSITGQLHGYSSDRCGLFLLLRAGQIQSDPVGNLAICQKWVWG